jgi:membrane-bound lytic murein transglycosylase D
MMTSSTRSRSLFLLISLAVSPTFVFSQVAAISSLRTTPNEIEKEDPRISHVISIAEKHYKQGLTNLNENRREQARDEFNRAVDIVLESGLDVRANPKLQNYYHELIEKIYRLEVPSQQAAPSQLAANKTTEKTTVPAASVQVGFRDQKFEPSPLDDLSKLTLTEEEKQVTAEDAARLEIAKSTIGFQFKSNPLIQQFINYYQGRGRMTMQNGLERSGRYIRLAKKIFREEGVPEDIVWLGQVESAWKPRAYSSAAASGLWQFIPSTGSRFGLRQNAWLDERNSFEKATRASARYLKFLANRYKGNWELALGAYNTGEGNVDRAISRAGSADFWQIYPYIASETRNYVPNILATILIANNPAKYGFRSVNPEPPLSYDIVRIPSSTSLQLIADACDTSVDYLRTINPELKREITPRGESYDCRVPRGKAKQFVSLLKRVPMDRRENARVITARPGETFQSVATRTGSNLNQLLVWNAGVDLTTGGKIVTPGGSMKNVSLVRPKETTAGTAKGSALLRVRAMRGDTIASLAARYGAGAEEVAKINGLASGSILKAGQMILVPSSATPTNGRSARRR